MARTMHTCTRAETIRDSPAVRDPLLSSRRRDSFAILVSWPTRRGLRSRVYVHVGNTLTRHENPVNTAIMPSTYSRCALSPISCAFRKFLSV